MKVEPRRLRGVRRKLDETLDWTLSAEEWAMVGTVLDSLGSALERDDPRGVDQALEKLAPCDPRRRAVRARPEPTPMPEELRERQNMLVHEIVVRVPEQPRPGTAHK